MAVEVEISLLDPGLEIKILGCRSSFLTVEVDVADLGGNGAGFLKEEVSTVGGGFGTVDSDGGTETVALLAVLLFLRGGSVGSFGGLDGGVAGRGLRQPGGKRSSKRLMTSTSLLSFFGLLLFLSTTTVFSSESSDSDSFFGSGA